jgi:hypothetical protein
VGGRSHMVVAVARHAGGTGSVDVLGVVVGIAFVLFGLWIARVRVRRAFAGVRLAVAAGGAARRRPALSRARRRATPG